LTKECFFGQKKVSKQKGNPMRLISVDFNYEGGVKDHIDMVEDEDGEWSGQRTGKDNGGEAVTISDNTIDQIQEAADAAADEIVTANK